MKHRYLTIFITFLICFSNEKSTAQWVPVYNDANAQFYDAAFPTDNMGYVAATDTGGTLVLNTNNGGATWNKRYIPGWDFISKLVMVDSLQGYLIKGGVPVKILKTYDGFNTYTTHNLDTSFSVQALCLLNDSTGFYLNNGTRLRKFRQNGAAYSYVIDTLTSGQNLQFVSPAKGFLDVGSGLLKTTDSGTTWVLANSSLGFFCITFKFADSLNGYFSDGSKIYKTNDGGITFPLNYTFPNTYSLAVSNHYCIAANDTGNVAYTTNGGVTWQRETTGINFIVPEPYNVVMSPGRKCYLLSQLCGEIRKRQPLLNTSVSDLSGQYNCTIYPNPATTQITLYSDKLLDNAELTVYNYLGQIVKQLKNISGQTYSFSRDNLPEGLYMVRITQGNNLLLAEKLIFVD